MTRVRADVVRAAPRGKRSALPTGAEIRQGIRGLVSELAPETIERFFGKGAAQLPWEGAKGLEARLGLPLPQEQLETSLSRPIQLGDDACLFRGHIYLDQHFAKTSAAFRGRPPQEISKTLMRQPWIEWKSGSYQFHESGAEQSLWKSLGERRVYRTTSTLESQLLVAIQELRRSAPTEARWREIARLVQSMQKKYQFSPEFKQTLTKMIATFKTSPPKDRASRDKVCQVLANIIHQNKVRGIFFSAQPQVMSRVIPGVRDVQVTFDADFSQAEVDVMRGTYIGIERSKVELSFMSSSARLFAIDRLEVRPPPLANARANANE